MSAEPIETRYAGCRFRSRLEARWAVFFDALGIKWEFEPQGHFVGPYRIPYLPDFWLPDSECWVEVKGKATIDDLEKVYYASIPENGLPGPSHGLRMILLGPIPEASEQVDVWHHGLSYFNPETELEEAEDIQVHLSGSGYGLYSSMLCLRDTSDGSQVEVIDRWGIKVDCNPKVTNERHGSIWNFDAFVADPLNKVGHGIFPINHNAYEIARSMRFDRSDSI